MEGADRNLPPSAYFLGLLFIIDVYEFGIDHIVLGFAAVLRRRRRGAGGRCLTLSIYLSSSPINQS
jgi:hypothetical protein